MYYDYIIVGSGFAGCVMAERIANKLNKKVLIIEKRSHIGGNCYDEIDKSGILIHKYGPHIFHTDNEYVFNYLSKFTKWHEYTHKVVASVDGMIIPIPFNINTLYKVFTKNKAQILEEKLISAYGKNKKIPILELLEANDIDLKELGKYIYDKIFVNYTTKQWGKKPEELDIKVTARVPILTSRDNRYFTDKYQVLPKHGYTKLFENMILHKNISLLLNTNAFNHLKIEKNKIYYNNTLFKGKLIFTGMIDELFSHKFGMLPYRSVDLIFKTFEKEFYQNHATINYPNEHNYTRITEFKHMLPIKKQKTTILIEYPQEYKYNKNIPYYPMFTHENYEKYEKYFSCASKINNLFLIGRLAEYKYYDMDDIVAHALKIFKNKIYYNEL